MTGALVASSVVVILLGAPRPMAERASDLSTAQVNHVGIVVTDVDAAVQQFVRVMGFAPAKPMTISVPMPDGRKAEIKFATLFMPNFHIEVVQPLNHQGPYYEHYQKHGMSIQHMGLAIPDASHVDELRAGLEQNGGQWTLGSKGGTFAYVGFEQTLGTSFELVTDRTAPAPPKPAGDALPPLASLPVTHVGLAAVSAAAAVDTFVKILGNQPPAFRDYKDAQYPPDAKWNPSAYLRLAFWNQGGMGIEVIESVGGPTPWSEYVQRQKGTAVQHVAINVGNRMDEMIRDLVAKGGRWTNGKAGGNYAYLDFMDTLGLIFELNGTSRQASSGH
jgi:catechol 2,3-dioxygenase-like lactoylglutathione lyase family enzyme